MTALATFIEHSTGSPSHSNQTRKRNKRHPNWKGKSKTVTVCRWHDTIYSKFCRLHQKIPLLEGINEFSKVAGYKIYMSKFVAFLYTDNKLSEKDIKKTNSFTIASKIIKYWEINLT